MITQYFYLPQYDWDIYIFYDSDKDDAPVILQALQKIGCSGQNLKRAKRNLRSGLVDTGLTYTSEESRSTISVIGHSSNPEQWWNTFSHEADHIAEHIASVYDIPCKGEEMRYLKGIIAQETISVAGTYICEHMCPYKLQSSRIVI